MLENYSSLVQNRSKTPYYLKAESLEVGGEFPIDFKFDFPNSNGVIHLFGELQPEGLNFSFKSLHYTTNITGVGLAFIDAVVELMQKRPVDQLVNLSVKEIDYFLRDKNSICAFGEDTLKMYRFFEFVISFHHAIAGKINTDRTDGKSSPDFEEDYLANNKVVYDFDKYGKFEELAKEVQFDQIQFIFDRLIRSFLQKDGGDIELAYVSGDMVAVTYTGACNGCDSSLTTTMDYIQNVLRKELRSPTFMVVTDS